MTVTGERPSPAAQNLPGTIADTVVDGDTAMNESAAATGDPVRAVTLTAGGHARTVRWGPDWHVGSAAFWVAQVAAQSDLRTSQHALGNSLREEVAACILGGFGLPASTGLAAFELVRDRGHLREGRNPSADELYRTLCEPLALGDGRNVRYRFPRQRSQRLATALQQLPTLTWSTPLELRAGLLTLPGVGPKTAAWVVRNHTGSDDVAIVDVHLLRAGVIAGVFSPTWTPARDYDLIEEFFLAWARAGKVRAADLDAVIWATMARIRNVSRVFDFQPASGSRFLLHAS